MIDPGRLREEWTLQARVRERDEAGGFQDPDWRDILDGTVWAEVVPISSMERLRRQQVGANVTHRVTIRYRPEVTAAMRLRRTEEGPDGELVERVLNIAEAPRDLGGRRAWLQFLCLEDA